MYVFKGTLVFKKGTSFMLQIYIDLRALQMLHFFQLTPFFSFESPDGTSVPLKDVCLVFTQFLSFIYRSSVIFHFRSSNISSLALQSMYCRIPLTYLISHRLTIEALGILSSIHLWCNNLCLLQLQILLQSCIKVADLLIIKSYI